MSSERTRLVLPANAPNPVEVAALYYEFRQQVARLATAQGWVNLLAYDEGGKIGYGSENPYGMKLNIDGSAAWTDGALRHNLSDTLPANAYATLRESVAYGVGGAQLIGLVADPADTSVPGMTLWGIHSGTNAVPPVVINGSYRSDDHETDVPASSPLVAFENNHRAVATLSGGGDLHINGKINRESVPIIAGTDISVTASGENIVISSTANGITRYVFEQVTPAMTWTINHNLNTVPTVTVIDSAGTQVEGNVIYSTLNTVTLEFGVAFAGKAYLL